MNLRDIAVKLMNGELPALAEGELGGERLKMCETCEHFSKLRQCKLCNCWMDLKVKILHASCPVGKW